MANSPLSSHVIIVLSHQSSEVYSDTVTKPSPQNKLFVGASRIFLDLKRRCNNKLLKYKCYFFLNDN